MKASEEAASREALEDQAVARPNQDLLHQERGEVLHFLFCVALGGLLYPVASFVFCISRLRFACVTLAGRPI